MQWDRMSPIYFLWDSMLIMFVTLLIHRFIHRSPVAVSGFPQNVNMSGISLGGLLFLHFFNNQAKQNQFVTVNKITEIQHL